MTPEPRTAYKLRCWRLDVDGTPARFWTCARPGRTADPKSRSRSVSDYDVSCWLLGVRALGEAARPTTLISLLGEKEGGRSEFSFYSFGPPSSAAIRTGGQQLSFDAWIAHYHPTVRIDVVSVPTVDRMPMEPSDLSTATSAVRELLTMQHNVVVVDSGGEQRTGAVCKFVGACEDAAKR